MKYSIKPPLSNTLNSQISLKSIPTSSKTSFDAIYELNSNDLFRSIRPGPSSFFPPTSPHNSTIKPNINFHDRALLQQSKTLRFQRSFRLRRQQRLSLRSHSFKTDQIRPIRLQRYLFCIRFNRFRENIHHVWRPTLNIKFLTRSSFFNSQRLIFPTSRGSSKNFLSLNLQLTRKRSA